MALRPAQVLAAFDHTDETRAAARLATAEDDGGVVRVTETLQGRPHVDLDLDRVAQDLQRGRAARRDRLQRGAHARSAPRLSAAARTSGAAGVVVSPDAAVSAT